MGRMFAWATPDFLLDHMTLEEVIFYYEQGLKFEEFEAELVVAKLGEALSGKKKNKGPQSDKPDKAAFYRYYGNKIERPNKGGEQ